MHGVCRRPGDHHRIVLVVAEVAGGIGSRHDDRVPAHIISASRRTDIPAFFTPWLMSRIRAGFVLVRNPRNAEHVMRVSLAVEDVIAIVFWSRDYGRLLGHLAELDDRGFRPCFQFTLTGYGSPMELRAPSIDRTLGQFEQLARRYGRDRVVWRYDPIVIGSRHDAAWHIDHFRQLAAPIAASASNAVVSFLDLYPSARRGLAWVTQTSSETFHAPPLAQRIEMAGELAAIGAKLGMRVRACCEPDVAASGTIQPAACIDREMIRVVSGLPSIELKAAPTRKGCGCVLVRDIGAYQSCAHGCVYCYANESPEQGLARSREVDPGANHLGVGDLLENKPAFKGARRQLCLALGGEGPGRAGR